MRRLHRKGLGFLLVVVVIALVGMLIWLSVLRRSGLPWREGEQTIPGLVSGAIIRYDEIGVPHIESPSTGDAIAALGWVHANDRFTQMELGRRAAAGRLAEILGEEALPADRYFRTLRFAATAQAMVTGASETSRRWLEAYARGVDAWLEARGGDLPPALRVLGVEPEPWKPADSLAFVLLMANDLSFWQGRPEEARFSWLRALGPDAVRDLLGEPELEIDPEILALAEQLGSPRSDIDADRPSGMPGDPVSPGSNNWAVGPSLSLGGRALLANDPHLGLTLPSVWYQVLVRSPDYSASGMSLPGVPGIVLGRGEHVAWAFTNTMLDDHDLVFEQIDEAAEAYLREGTWHPLEVSEEIISIRGGGEDRLRLRSTELGPLLEADETLGLPPRSLLWTLYQPGDPLAALAAVSRARAPDDVLAGIAPYVGPAQNLVAAFDDGQLLFTVLGAIPDRGGASLDPEPLADMVVEATITGEVTADGATAEPSHAAASPGSSRGRLPVAGWSGQVSWRGLRSRATHPLLLQPANDQLVTANHDIRPAGYAMPLVAEFFPGHRARRITERLERDGPWDVEGFAELQTDIVSLFAHDLLVAMERDADAFEGDALRAWETLVTWDGAMSVRGPSALFALVERNLLSVFFADEAKAHGLEPFADRSHLLRLLAGSTDVAPALDTRWFDDVTTSARETRQDGLRRALADAWREGTSRWGENPTRWNYGGLHTLTLRHPLDPLPLFGPWARRGPFDMPGSNTTVAAFGAIWQGDVQEITFGPSMRWVVDWSRPETAFAALPGGQSGHPADLHYDDRLDAFLTGRLEPARWSPEAIARATVSTLRLRPGESRR